jgi:hypothetical protein
MHPGTDCNACHRSSREGPVFQVAGTVYPDMSSADDCAGVAGVNVKVTDANNNVFNLVTNEAGNFFMTSRQGTLALPYSIVLSKDGRNSAMSSTQSSAACASCHTTGGASGASGRVMAP